jgi:WD40 repeat protein
LEDPDPNLLIVYDLQSGYVYRRWRRDLSITCVAISSMASLVVCGMEDGTVVVWDLKTGNEKYYVHYYRSLQWFARVGC